LPRLFQPGCRLVTDRTWRRQYTARTATIVEELSALALDRKPLRSGQAARVQRRDSDQRVKQAVHAVVDDLGRRHGDVDRLDSAQIVLRELVVDAAIFGDQRRDPLRIE